MFKCCNFRILNLVLLSIIFSFLASRLIGQEQAVPIEIGQQFVIKSRVLDQDRSVMLYLPDSYDYGNQAYPVLYMTDARSHFYHFSAIADFQAQVNRMPEIIIVALVNIDRTHDLSPNPGAVLAKKYPTAGGANRFIAFIRDELIPFIEKNYRTQPYRLHVGNSLGGLLVAHSFVTEPDLFNAYISISPPLHWNNFNTLTKMDQLLSGIPLQSKFFYMTMADADREIMLKGTRDMAAVLARHPDQGVRFTYKMMENEDHSSNAHRSLYNALEALYDGWKFDWASVVAGQSPLQMCDHHFSNLSRRFGYKITAPENLLLIHGYRLLGRGQIAEAIELFEANAERHPESGPVYDSLGDGYTAAGRLTEALKSYEKAVELGEKSNHPDLIYFKANVERTMQKL